MGPFYRLFSYFIIFYTVLLCSFHLHHNALDALHDCIANGRSALKTTSQDQIIETVMKCKSALHDCQDMMISAASYKDHYFIIALVLSLLVSRFLFFDGFHFIDKTES